MEAGLRDVRAELARWHDLEDVAREDVLLRFLDGRDEISGRLAVFCEEVELFAALRRIVVMRHIGRGELALDVRHLLLDFLIDFFDARFASAQVGKINQARAVLERVNDDEDAAEHELAEEFFVANLHAAHAVERRDDFIIEVADEAAIGKRQIRVFECGAELLHVLLDGLDGVAVEALHEVVLLHHELVFEDLDARERLGAEEREAAELLMRRIDGFEHEAFFLADELVIHGNGRVEIHVDFGRDSDEVALGREFLKGCEVWQEFHDGCFPPFVVR